VFSNQDVWKAARRGGAFQHGDHWTYVLTSQIFPILEETRSGRGGEIQLTDGIRMLSRNNRFMPIDSKGHVTTRGDKLDSSKATVEFALKRDDLGSLRQY